ncbi:MAG: hypothetical protein A2Z20_00530 [Bdellovibrionales bacterium RBG_16_40_8]|nr:MAG: hypothetical protein A2Z20_00530 [Bdellovibrionales bacterium RBG_16_40_8]
MVNTAAQTGLIVSGTCETGITVVLWGTGVSSTVGTACVAGIFSDLITFSAGDGVKEIRASQTDLVGNIGTSIRNFIKDTVAPAVAITSPLANSYVGASTIISGTCETGLNVILSGSGTVSPVTSACLAGAFNAIVNFTSDDGAKQTTASQTDAAGNIGFDSRSFVRDSTTPIVSILSPAADSVFRTNLTLTGACEDGLIVNISGTGVASAQTTTCSASTFSLPVTFSSAEGTKNIIASQTDAAGNTGSDNRNFIRDSIAPVIMITSPAANSSSPTAITISGTCENSLIVNIYGDVDSPSTTSCTSGTFNAAINFSAIDGIKNIIVSQTDIANNVGTDNRNFIRSAINSATETYISKGPGGKVDILFVDDNSASMETEQAALGTRFSAFTTALSGVDWQAGIITTDCTVGSTNNYCGQLFDLTGRPAGEYILSPSTPSYTTVFQNTIQRPETLNCLMSGTCPSGREEGMKSTIEAFNLRNADNVGFFRNDADLAVVFLSDEDEQSTGPIIATQPSTVVSAFQTIWGTAKKLSSYGIIVKPGDTACYNTQQAQFGGNANYGNLLTQLSTLTGGMSVSICEPDYSITLTQIGNDVTQMSKSYDLATTPLVGSVTVTFTPSFSTTFTVSGNRVTFAALPPLGTQIDISYQY